MSRIPSLHKQGENTSLDRQAELRNKLWRRLIWKAPLIFLLVSFAVWWQWREEATLLPSKAAEAINGYWSGQVTYSWGEKFTEQFFLQPEGSKLFGTASFLGAKRGIEEGRIEGENIAFFIRFQENSGGIATDHKNYYWGTLEGEKMRMRLQDDRGNPPLDFVLSKIRRES